MGGVNRGCWGGRRTYQPESSLKGRGDWEFAEMGGGLGGDGVRVRTRRELAAALANAHATRGRFQLIEAVSPRGVLSQTLSRFVAGVKPRKAGERSCGIPSCGGGKDAAAETGATVSVIYVPPGGAAAAIGEACEADLDLAICITEGIPVRDMVEGFAENFIREVASTRRGDPTSSPGGRSNASLSPEPS